MARWIDEIDKKTVLEELDKLYPHARTGSCHHSHKGHLDALWVPFLRQINRSRGLITMSSCEGHWDDEQDDNGDTYWIMKSRPCLRVRCSKAVSEKVYEVSRLLVEVSLLAKGANK